MARRTGFACLALMALALAASLCFISADAARIGPVDTDIITPSPTRFAAQNGSGSSIISPGSPGGETPAVSKDPRLNEANRPTAYPELMGKTSNQARVVIEADGYNCLIMDPNDPGPYDFNSNRVVVRLDAAGKVAKVPWQE